MKFKLLSDNLFIPILLPYIIYTLFESGITFPSGIVFTSSVIIAAIIIDFIFKQTPGFAKEIFLVSVICFFYSLILFKDTLHVIHKLKFQYFLVYFFGGLVLLFLSLKVLKVKYYKNLSLLFLIFSITIIPTKIYSNYFNKKYILDNSSKIKNNNLKINSDCSSNKPSQPIVLIILDELSSDLQIKSNSIQIENPLAQNEKLIYLNRLRSSSKQTKVSLPSIFNYNLSNDSLIKLYENKDEYLTTSDGLLIDLFKNNSLNNELRSKRWKTHSFGLVDFKDAEENKNFIHEWDRNNTDLIGPLGKFDLTNNLFRLSIVNFLEKRDFNQKFPLASKIRTDTFQVFDSIQFKNENFYYFHLYMPHFPYHYPNEFEFQEESLENYIKYRNFTLNKLSRVLENDNFKNVKLIITGDHGYRWNDDVDPYETCAWFLGFDDCEIKNINVVQDIGSLIYNSTY